MTTTNIHYAFQCNWSPLLPSTREGLGEKQEAAWQEGQYLKSCGLSVIGRIQQLAMCCINVPTHLTCCFLGGVSSLFYCFVVSTVATCDSYDFCAKQTCYCIKSCCMGNKTTKPEIDYTMTSDSHNELKKLPKATLYCLAKSVVDCVFCPLHYFFFECCYKDTDIEKCLDDKGRGIAKDFESNHDLY